MITTALGASLLIGSAITFLWWAGGMFLLLLGIFHRVEVWDDIQPASVQFGIMLLIATGLQFSIGIALLGEI